jgi:HEAT repeat protein
VRGDRFQQIGQADRRRITAGVALAVCLLGACGCANFWDQVTSRNFKVKDLFTKREAMVVLRTSGDGDERAQALLKLKEPIRNGGTQQLQDEVMELLANTAVRDPQPLCRLAAIQKLGEFKDDRNLKPLQDAFYNAGDFGSTTPAATRIQCQALAALGQTGNPAAVPFLIEKLKEPPALRSDLAQQRTDRCTAAARSLARMHDPRGNEALAQILRNDKEDLAVRERALLALQDSTGQRLPADFQAWEDYLHGHPAGEEKKIKLAGFLSLF